MRAFSFLPRAQSVSPLIGRHSSEPGSLPLATPSTRRVVGKRPEHFFTQKPEASRASPVIENTSSFSEAATSKPQLRSCKTPFGISPKPQIYPLQPPASPCLCFPLLLFVAVQERHLNTRRRPRHVYAKKAHINLFNCARKTNLFYFNTISFP